MERSRKRAGAASRFTRLMMGRRPLRPWKAAPVALVAVVLGYVVVRILAAGSGAGFLVSGATLSGNAQVVTNAGALGGSEVVFGVSPTPAPTATPTPTATPGGTICNRSATTSTFASQVSAATAGQTICLADGNYGTWTGTNKAI